MPGFLSEKLWGSEPRSSGLCSKHGRVTCPVAHYLFFHQTTAVLAWKGIVQFLALLYTPLCTCHSMKSSYCSDKADKDLIFLGWKCKALSSLKAHQQGQCSASSASEKCNSKGLQLARLPEDVLSPGTDINTFYTLSLHRTTLWVDDITPTLQMRKLRLKWLKQHTKD